MTGSSGLTISGSSSSTSDTRFILAILMDIITNIIISIIILIRMLMQYARRLVSSPVVSSLPTIILAPIQLMIMMHE